MVNKQVFIIKLIHSIIFFIMVICLFYVLYGAFTRTYNVILLIALAAIFLEGLVLLLNRWQCPLTNLAKRYGDETGTITDIFLPAWLSPHTFKIFGALLAIGLVMLGFGYFMK